MALASPPPVTPPCPLTPPMSNRISSCQHGRKPSAVRDEKIACNYGFLGLFMDASDGNFALTSMDSLSALRVSGLIMVSKSSTSPTMWDSPSSGARPEVPFARCLFTIGCLRTDNGGEERYQGTDNRISRVKVRSPVPTSQASQETEKQHRTDNRISRVYTTSNIQPDE